MDLEARGLLDETLVVCITEHGRTPKIKSEQGGGCDHWARAYSSVLAGGGVGVIRAERWIYFSSASRLLHKLLREELSVA